MHNNNRRNNRPYNNSYLQLAFPLYRNFVPILHMALDYRPFESNYFEKLSLMFRFQVVGGIFHSQSYPHYW